MFKFLAACCIAIAMAAAVQAAPTASRPNILLFLGDNWAAPHAGILGDRLAKTPTFDAVAREGVLFRNAFCPVPSCSPTRSSLLTGRAAHQLEDAASLWSAFPRHLQTFTDLLGEAGYEVGFCGKGWSPGNYQDFGRSDNPAGKQFKTFDDFLAKRDPARPYCFWIGNTDTALHEFRKQWAEISAAELAEVQVPPDFPDVPDVPDVRRDIAAYHRGIARMDEAAARALAALDEHKLTADTIVIYGSDNGWQMPRGLANCYDGGTHVPLAICWPGHFSGGRVAEEFVSLTDLAPTILELASCHVPSEMTGRSMTDLLEGHPRGPARDAVFLERERHANVRKGNLSYPMRAVRTREFLYIRNLRADRWPAGDPEFWRAVGPYGDVDGSLTKEFILAHAGDPQTRRFYELGFAKRPAEELYDLRRDPHQLTNVAKSPEYAPERERLAKRVDQWMRSTGDPRVDPGYDRWDEYRYYGPPLSKKKAR